MRYQLQSFRFIGTHLLSRLGQVCAGTVTAGFALVSFSVASANPATAVQLRTLNTAPAVTSQSTGQSMNPATNSQRVNNTALEDGIYLYGQSTQRDQTGHGYFVFEVNHGKVLGALYMPNSSFDCASGGFNTQALSLTVVNSYDRTTNPYAIALDTTSTVADRANPSLKQIGLEGFYPLQVSDNDRRILNVCKADLQK